MDNSIANMRPELVSEWSEKNAPMTPQEVPFGSNKLYWWKGACGHEWQTSAKARSHGEKCPICSNARIIPGVNDLESLYPELTKEWSPENEKLPSEVGPGSHKKAIWIGECGHTWTSEIRARVRGAGCPYCSHNLVLTGFNDLEKLFPDVAKEWSPRNLPLKPSQVTAYANKKVWWRCEHGHEWYTLISTRSYGSKCPYCSGIQLLKGFNDLATRHPELAKEWSERNYPLAPSDINEKSTRNVWWKCGTCGNEYKAVVKSRVHGLQCPVCAERAVLKGYNDLATTDPDIAAEWHHEKNSRTPENISRYSLYPVWWMGRCGHEWKDKVANRTIEGAGCIYCESVFRRALPGLLVMLYAGRKKLRVIFGDENAIGARLDAYIPESRLAFVFPDKGTNREQSELEVMRHICERQQIRLEQISYTDPLKLCTEIKQGFTKCHIYISSDNEKDIAFIRQRFMDKQQHR